VQTREKWKFQHEQKADVHHLRIPKEGQRFAGPDSAHLSGLLANDQCFSIETAIISSIYTALSLLLDYRNLTLERQETPRYSIP
jgi:hypothetical protein